MYYILKKLKIAIDIDDTIEYLLKAWIGWLNSKYGMNIFPEQITSWEVTSFFPQLTPDQVFEPLRCEEFWKTVEPMPDAVEYVKKLMDDGHEVYLCTTTYYKNIKPKFEYVVQKHFPYIEWSQVIVTSRKQLLDVDILVDDGIHNLEGGNYYKVLFSAPHNRNIDANANKMARADNWKEVYEEITSIARFKELLS